MRFKSYEPAQMTLSESSSIKNTLVNVYVDLLVLRVLPVLYRPEVVDIGVNNI